MSVQWGVLHKNLYKKSRLGKNCWGNAALRGDKRLAFSHVIQKATHKFDYVLVSNNLSIFLKIYFASKTVFHYRQKDVSYELSDERKLCKGKSTNTLKRFLNTFSSYSSWLVLFRLGCSKVTHISNYYVVINSITKQ